MAKYSIDSSTLTALGDVIRNKVYNLDELPVLKPEPFTMNYSASKGPHNSRSFHLNKVSKIKAIVSIVWGTTGLNGVMPIWVAPGVFDGGYNPKPDGAIILPKEEDAFPYEVIIEGADIGFGVNQGSGYKPATITVELIGLDKNGNEFKYTPAEVIEVISSLNLIPESAYNITGNCQYKFAYGGWDWFINDNLKTYDISNASNMFYDSRAKEIPFELNLTTNASFNDIFNNMLYLQYAPKLNTTFTLHRDFGGLFQRCYRLKEVPDWLGDLLEKDYNISSNNTTFAPWDNMFNSCYSLRFIPEKVMKYIANPNMSNYYYGVVYSKPFSSCFCLDELVNIYCDNYNLTSNYFNSFFYQLYRVKDITFATNEDGSAVVRPWKSQTLDMTTYIGYAVGPASIIDYNSGITADKEVKDDATYQALKNDPDYFTLMPEYSRYTHASAVRTIASLPDCSATGTNIIKFKGISGSLTDEGAINTLTDEEIAIASAKGWTVSLV